jgi:hypothetical protein
MRAIRPSRLVSLSARANVGPGASVLIGGFAIAGSAAETVLLRGIGPALANYGVPGVLARPVLTLFNSAGVPLATNSGWGGGADSGRRFPAGLRLRPARRFRRCRDGCDAGAGCLHRPGGGRG